MVDGFPAAKAAGLAIARACYDAPPLMLLDRTAKLPIKAETK